MLNFQVQNTLAKLLAREDINIQHGNFSTAWFDVENRTLGLPLWKNRGKDVYDLLVGHEVGHALYTPAEGWHQSIVDLGIPRGYVNVVEDIRIERLIQSKYPGLVGCFKRGYKVLDDEDFFGLSKIDNVNECSLIDRINLKAKLRDLIEVEFTAEEQPLVDMAFAVQTFDDVIEACKALYNFAKEQQSKNVNFKIKSLSNKGDVEDGVDSSMDSESVSISLGEDGDNTPSEISGSKDNDGKDKGSANVSGADATEGKNDDDNGHSQVLGAGRTSDIDDVITDRVFQSAQRALIETDARGNQPQYVRAITRAQTEEMVVPYKVIAPIRKEHKDNIVKNSYIPADSIKSLEDDFNAFESDTKKFVGIMAKEFEMRKSAYQHARATTARSGSLDVNRLYNYKLSDDIFNRVTTLADAKSHGMVMFIDFSGSMSSILKDTIKQTLTLASFCKKVNIPFDVYSFTTRNSINQAVNTNEIDHRDAHIVHILSSSFRKADYNEAYKHLYMMGASIDHFSFGYRGNMYWNSREELGGTPLNETIMASRFLLRDFKRKHGVQKVNAIFLTDGEAAAMMVNSIGIDVPVRGYAIDLDGVVVTGQHTRNLTDLLIAELAKEFNVIGFFLAERMYEFRGQVWASSDKFVTTEIMTNLRKEYNQNKFVAFKNARGYDHYFIVKAAGRSLDTDSDEFEVSDNAKKGEIQRAFKKFASSKKANRMLATQFAQIIA